MHHSTEKKIPLQPPSVSHTSKSHCIWFLTLLQFKLQNYLTKLWSQQQTMSILIIYVAWHEH
jgi:hypothetical protein